MSDVGADVREVFDLFDFWDGRDGLVDGFKVGDFLRCCGLNPTQTQVFTNGGMKKLGTIQYNTTSSSSSSSSLSPINQSITQNVDLPLKQSWFMYIFYMFIILVLI